MKLLLLQFNNYFNRIIKKYSNVEDYISHSSNSGYANPSDTNFKPYDQIATEHIINWAKKWSPDYLICIDEENANNIVGRWFITESVRTRQGQFKLSLKRDVIAEKLDLIVNSPCFVKKGHVSNDNPLIFNREDFDCNQIKQQECLLKDKSKTSWIAIYYNLSKKSDLKGSVSTIEQEYIYTGATSLATWSFWTDFHEGYKIPKTKILYVYAECANTLDEALVVYDRNLNIFAQTASQSDTGLSYNKGVSETLVAIQECINSNKNGIKTALGLYEEPSMTLENFLDHNGKLYKVGSSYYRINITPNAENTTDEYLSEGSLFDALSNAFKVGGTFKAGWSGDFDEAFRTRIIFNNYSVDFIEETQGVHTYDFDFENCQDVQDAPYGLLCLPYKSDNTSPAKVLDGDWNLSLLIARKLCEKGVGFDKPIFDIQIVPYCPLDLGTQVYADGSMSYNYLTDLSANQYSMVTEGLLDKLIVLHPEKVNFVKTINAVVDVNITAQMHFAVTEGKGQDYKVENQCTFYRFVSPNYNGQFEFNRAKNRDFKVINIDCTYKPYQPYIHVNPDFGGLYGRDYNDARGLICGGDFSITVITSAWESYKLQNKNFQEIFNRQIQSMDTMHKYGMIEQTAGALTGIGGGALSGALVGGGVPGAIAGGTASAVGGVADLVLSQKKFAEQRDLAIDMHNFQLGNIKALPDSLSKVDAFNENNKLFPILERYSCTDEEIEIFKNKIKYEGMTINALGKIKDYIDTTEDMTFVKGQLIRLDDLNEESHFAYEIYNEVSKGVYIYGYSEFNQ